MEKVEIYTDGACQGNPGPGGWGTILRYKGTEKELSGYAPATTNNRMELQAAIEGLQTLTRPMDVHLYTDSLYLKDGITKWLPQWKQKNWRTSSHAPVKNKDLWEVLDVLSQKHTITWLWVRGHTGHPENERADALARAAIESSVAV